MHVLYLHQHFVARTGSCGGRSHEFSRLLVERGHRVTLITGAHELSGLKGCRQREIDGIDVRVIDVGYSQKMSMARRIGSFLSFMLRCSWIALCVPRPDVVFATSTPLTIIIPAVLVALLRGRPFVFEVRDLWPEVPIRLGLLRNPVLRLLARALERLAYRMARRIVVLSPGVREVIAQSGVPAARITVIPNSSDLDLFRVDVEEGRRFRTHHGAIGDRPLLVYAGAFGMVNGLDYLIDLARYAAATDPAVAFLLVGQGREKEHLVERARSLGLLDRTVFFHDPVPRSALPVVLSAANMLSSFVAPVPILELNSANKFFDAFAAGKPVVINHAGWQAELLNSSGAGLVLPPADPAAGAARLVAALHDPTWLDAASAAARRLGEEVFDRCRLADVFAKVLTSAVENDGGAIPGWAGESEESA